MYVMNRMNLIGIVLLPGSQATTPLSTLSSIQVILQGNFIEIFNI